MSYCCITVIDCAVLLYHCHRLCRIAVGITSAVLLCVSWLSQSVSFCCIPVTECVVLLYPCHRECHIAVCITVIVCAVLLCATLSYRVYCCVQHCRIVCTAVCSTVVSCVLLFVSMSYRVYCCVYYCHNVGRIAVSLS